MVITVEPKSSPKGSMFSPSFSVSNAPKVGNLLPPMVKFGSENKQAAKPSLTTAEKAFVAFEKKYTAFVNSVDIAKFYPKKVNQYIKRAEAWNGAYSEQEIARFKEMAASKNPDLIKQLALEFRVGISKKDEKEAMAAFGRLVVLYRNNITELQKFLQKKDMDPNLRAYVQTLVMMYHVERWLRRYRRVKSYYANLKQGMRQAVTLNGMLVKKDEEESSSEESKTTV
ncbi:MAG: hypothetical protein KTR14_09620 [Vampirovibrio sp.]|nr:hypothetical protein [Vampirovibrio sp.]